MKLPRIVIPLAVLVLLGVVSLTFLIHRSWEEKVIFKVQDTQFLLARHFAGHIKSHLDAHAQGIQLLSRSASLQYQDTKQIANDIQAHLKDIGATHPEIISVYDEMGKIIYSTDEKVIGGNYAHCEFFDWAKQPENKGKVSVFTQNRSCPGFLLATPLYQEAMALNYRKPTKKFAGVLAVTVNLNEWLSEAIPVSPPKAEPHQAWVVDNNGRLLVQSEHPEMALRSIYQRDESCNRCHLSFDYAEKILTVKQGTVDYQLKGGPKKLAAYASMEFSNASWVVVLNTSYEKVTAATRGSLLLTLLLLGVVSGILGGSSILLIRSYRFIAKAEEERKYLQEKSALEEKIRKSEERYRTMVETAHDIVWTLDRQGNFTFVNKRGEEFSGYKASEWMGKSFAPLIHPEDLAKVQQVFVETLSGRPLSYEVRVYDQDGEILTLSVNTVPLYEGNEVVGTVSFGRDITEDKRAEEALRFERDKAISIFAAMEDGVYIVTPQYGIEYVNPTLLKEFGPIEGRKCYEYFHDRNEPCPWCPNQEVFAGNTVRWEWFSFKNQKTYDLIDVPLRNPDGTISKLEIFRDITESKRAEEKIKRHVAELERFNRLAVGRELKMIELKERIRQLEAERGTHP